MERWTHLRRKREIGSAPLLFTDNDSQFVYDLGFTHTLKSRTRIAICDDLRCSRGQKLSDPRNTVADNILKQFPRKPTNPVSFIGKHCSGISAFADLVAVVTLHMQRAATQKAVLD